MSVAVERTDAGDVKGALDTLLESRAHNQRRNPMPKSNQHLRLRAAVMGTPAEAELDELVEQHQAALGFASGLQEQYENEKARGDDLEQRMDEEIVAHGRTEEQLEVLDEKPGQPLLNAARRLVKATDNAERNYALADLVVALEADSNPAMCRHSRTSERPKYAIDDEPGHYLCLDCGDKFPLIGDTDQWEPKALDPASEPEAS